MRRGRIAAAAVVLIAATAATLALSDSFGERAAPELAPIDVRAGDEPAKPGTDRRDARGRRSDGDRRNRGKSKSGRRHLSKNQKTGARPATPPTPSAVPPGDDFDDDDFDDDAGEDEDD